MASKNNSSRKRSSNSDIRSFFGSNATKGVQKQRLENDPDCDGERQDVFNAGALAADQSLAGSSRTIPLVNDIANALNKKLGKAEIEQLLMETWKPPLNYKFPSAREGNQNRKFQARWFGLFDWLAYSPSQNGAFCKICVLFASSEASGQPLGTLVTCALATYKDALSDLGAHAKHNYHLFAAQKAGEFRRLLESKTSVPVLLDKNKADIIQFNRKRLVPIVKTIVLCARCKLPLRGHRDNEDMKSEDSLRACASGQHGVFRALLAFRIDSGDLDLKDHLSSAKKNCTMISWQIQNEIIESIGKCLQKQILDRVKKNRFFSILCDETTDISTTEQMTICVRYVDMDNFKVHEDFLGFVNVTSTTGQSLKEYLCTFLHAAGLSLADCRGQGFDGGSNMSGKFRGLQALIREEQELAFYVHCFSHCLNLSVSKGCEVPLVRNMLGILASVTTFLSASAKRLSVLTKVIDESGLNQSRKQKLKPLCQTRWTERHNSVLIFRELYPFILQALEQIQNDKDGKAASSATVLEAGITRGDFIVALEAAVSVLSHTHGLSVSLQDPKLDLSESMGSILAVIEALKRMKESPEETFRPIFENATKTSDITGSPITVPRTCQRQTHRNNANASSPEDYYRQAIFVPLLEHFITDLSSRFNGTLKNVFALQGLIPCKLGGFSNDEILQAARVYEQDLPCVSMDEVLSELSMWRGRWTSEEVKPESAVEALVYCKYMFPNLRILLQIFGTLPVTTATAERTFSVLRLLKTFLRSTMAEERLNGLALASVYKNEEIDVNAVIDQFAKDKPRRLEYLDWSED